MDAYPFLRLGHIITIVAIDVKVVVWHIFDSDEENEILALGLNHSNKEG